MNKYKRNIILLQANAMKRLVSEVGPNPIEDRKETLEQYKGFNTTPPKAANLCANMSNSRQAALLRIIAFNENAYMWSGYPLYGNHFSIKVFMMYVTDVYYFLHWRSVIRSDTIKAVDIFNKPVETKMFNERRKYLFVLNRKV